MSRIIGRATFLMTTATGGGIQMRIKMAYKSNNKQKNVLFLFFYFTNKRGYHFYYVTPITLK